MSNKKQKRCIKRIHLVTDDGLYNGKAFCKVEIVYIHPLKICLLKNEVQLKKHHQ